MTKSRSHVDNVRFSPRLAEAFMEAGFKMKEVDRPATDLAGDEAVASSVNDLSGSPAEAVAGQPAEDVSPSTVDPSPAMEQPDVMLAEGASPSVADPPQAQLRAPKPKKIKRVEVEQPKVELVDNAVWDDIPFKQFYEFDTVVLAVLVNAIRERGRRPVVSFDIDVADALSQVVFSLAVLPGKGGEPRIQMKVLGGFGQPAVLFANSVFFRDELFDYVEAPPARFHRTWGLKGYLQTVLSVRDASGAR